MSTTNPKPLEYKIIEYPLVWPTPAMMSTHELVCDASGVYVTGQNMHCLAKVTYSGDITFRQFPGKPGPHGLLIDKHGRLWVSFEFEGKVVRLDSDLNIVQTVDVHIYAKGAHPSINPAPHGIGLDADGETIWFTGKRTSTIGRIDPDGTVEHFELPQLAALPIFLSAGPDGNIWGTELLGCNILHITKSGEVREYLIPTPQSRPIAVIPDPSEPFMWFTEEAGRKIGKIDMNGNITEYRIPLMQPNTILGSLSFDNQGNLWVQCYIDLANKIPAGNDYILKIDKSIRHATGSDLAGVPVLWNKVPSQNSMMHRIRMGNDGNMWFTEMATNTLGKIVLV